MILKKKISIWLNKFKPGTRFTLKCLLDGKPFKGEARLCISYPEFCKHTNSWHISITGGDIMRIYEHFSGFIYKVQEVIEIIEDDTKEEN